MEGSEDDDMVYLGTGFAVNIPDMKKLCVMTAAHNILHVGAGHVRRIQVTFPNALTFDVGPHECFVSSVYGDNPTRNSNDASSIADYGLIAIDLAKHGIEPTKHPGGCAFSVWRTKYDLLKKPITVHGYLQGKPEQAKGISSLDHIDPFAVYYSVDTVGGVSGGPVFSMNDDGTPVAVAIQYE